MQDWYANWPIELAVEDMQHKVGDGIYVPGAAYLSHGADDFCGGLCRITHIRYGGSGGKRVPFIQFAERPGWETNYVLLLEKQDSLRALFGTERGHMDPDLRPDFNDGRL